MKTLWRLLLRKHSNICLIEIAPRILQARAVTTYIPTLALIFRDDKWNELSSLYFFFILKAKVTNSIILCLFMLLEEFCLKLDEDSKPVSLLPVRGPAGGARPLGAPVLSSPPSAQGHKRGWGCSPAVVDCLLRNYYNAINISLQFQEKTPLVKNSPRCWKLPSCCQNCSKICLEKTELTFLYSVMSVTSFYVSVFEFLMAANILWKPLYFLNMRKAIAIWKLHCNWKPAYLLLEQRLLRCISTACFQAGPPCAPVPLWPACFQTALGSEVLLSHPSCFSLNFSLD